MSSVTEYSEAGVVADGRGQQALCVRNLCVQTTDGRGIVRDVSFDVPAGELIGLIGESGSGKTTTGLACLGHAQRGARIAGGSVTLPDGTEILGLPEKERAPLRGRVISYVPQNPGSSLNPRRRIRDHFLDRMGGLDSAEQDARIAQLIDDVRLPADHDFATRFPHELSGGQQQRVLIALALVHRPQVVVFDEPTTGLDVTTQARVLSIIDELRREFGTTMLYITHDQAVIADIAQTAAVMYAGRLVEVAPARKLFASPRHPYTAALVAAAPHERAGGGVEFRGIPGSVPNVGESVSGCAFEARCTFSRAECTESAPALTVVTEPGHSVACHMSRDWGRVPEVEGAVVSDRSPEMRVGGVAALVVDHLNASYTSRSGGRARRAAVLHDVSVRVPSGATVAVVGESGSGKSTLARCIAGLQRPDGGDMQLMGQALGGDVRKRTQTQREAIGLVFQNPAISLNPLQRVGQIIARPLEVRRGVSSAQRREAVAEALELVRLSDSILIRYPRELSGGQQQRVAIARALVLSPRLLLCDEVTASLDVSVQASILELLLRIQAEKNMSMVFISHDLQVVRGIADEVVVLMDGTVREAGSAGRIFTAPADEYTKSLLAASPTLG